MSVFGDFQQVWLQRFPQSDLPARWEEDVRANLAKHKQTVATLREELEKEEVYVEYLERLLSDIEEHKRKIEIEKGENVLENKAANLDNSLSKRKSELIVPTAPPIESPENENTINKCITELSATINDGQLVTSNLESCISEAMTPTSNDPSNFITVIKVNGLKSAEIEQPPTPAARPPKPPIKPRLRNSNSQQDDSPGRTSSIESLRSIQSSTEQLSATDEPFYDIVATDENTMIKSIDSSTENVFTMANTLPMPAAKLLLRNASIEPQSPEPTSNYVNIEYFLIKTSADADSSDDEDAPVLRKNVDDGSYASSSSLESSTPASRRKYSQSSTISTDLKVDEDRSSMYKTMLLDIIESESNYVDWLYVLGQYMKAIKATVATSQPVLSQVDFETIFYKIPDLYKLHFNFLENLKRHASKWDTKIGDCFKNMALNLEIYGAFLANYGRAIDTVRKCSLANSQFAEITKSITCKQVSGPPVSLEDLLHKPVARVQKNALSLVDLLKSTPKYHQDFNSLKEALHLTQAFLDQYNIIQTKTMFPTNDRAQRRLVKNSFIVEYADNHRKLRHLFLFNDVIACAKYKSSGKNDKYTFELKWFIPVEDILIIDENMANNHEVSPANIVSLKSQASNVRDQIRQEERSSEDKKIRLGRGVEKNKKRLLELESQLVLVSPNIMFKIRNKHVQKPYVFFLSSEFECTQWIETIHTLQQTCKPPVPIISNFSMFELQAWITACRTYLIPNMGSYLLRSGHDECLLIGDLQITIHELQGLDFIADLYICIEVDFYGHFFRQAKTKTTTSIVPNWNESFTLDLEGCANLRILIYREDGSNSKLFGKYTQGLTREWLEQHADTKFKINQYELHVGLKFYPNEVSLRRVPTGKIGALFGEKIQGVCKRQKRYIPFIISACIREVERRGMNEVGIYRVSGSSSDLQKLKKSFETNSYEAEQLLKEVDIHSVTGVLKLYLRELPEALFTDNSYSTLISAYNQTSGNSCDRIESLKKCIKELPRENKETITFILDHLIRVNEHENDNKMSLHNLATVFGPTLLRPGAKHDASKQKDLLATGTADVMAQAGILFCYLHDISSSKKKC